MNIPHYDLSQSDEDANEAIHRVDSASNPIWKAAASAAVIMAAQKFDQFIVDDVWPLMDASVTTHDLRAMGPVVRRAAKAGVICKTDQYKPSPRRHSTPQVVWQSLIKKS